MLFVIFSYNSYISLLLEIYCAFTCLPYASQVDYMLQKDKVFILFSTVATASQQSLKHCSQLVFVE